MCLLPPRSFNHITHLFTIAMATMGTIATINKLPLSLKIKTRKKQKREKERERSQGTAMTFYKKSQKIKSLDFQPN